MSGNLPELDKKKEHISHMFDDISEKYDRLNKVLSLHLDTRWRKKTIKQIPSREALEWLDVSTGTADLAILAAEIKKARVTGVDISEKMLAIGAQKIKKKKLEKQITLQLGDAESLPFEDNHFDVCTVAFGVRNFEHLEKGIAEMYRCLKPGGIIVILEFSTPQKWPFKQGHKLYTEKIVPFIGKQISKNTFAYQYLPDSIEQFPYGDQFLKKLSEAQFQHVCAIPLTMGVATIYKGIK